VNPDVRVDRIESWLFLASRPLDDGLDVRATLLLGTKSAVVIDTLARPQDMAPFLELIERSGLPCSVVDTHADWDHAWGNCAFPKSAILGHTDCYTRLRSREARETLARKRRERPGFYDGVRLVAPSATFDTQMTIDAGGFEVELHHLPGHTSDSIVAYVPAHGLLVAGDCVEDPFPLLESGPLDEWIARLRSWAARDIKTVVPAHGPVSGPELLLANAEYLSSLRSEPSCPVASPSFYVEAHRRNVETAASM
jgi:glyoxylase-like metal-dependent hydrolase (beta-lactamase superfamily II)